MHPSLRCYSARAHNPLIKFLGKRTYPSTPEARHPHPAAPAEFKERFSQFLAKMNSSASSESVSQKSSNSRDSGVTVYNNFWEAPAQLWKPRVHELDDAEIEAIMSGGASSY